MAARLCIYDLLERVENGKACDLALGAKINPVDKCITCWFSRSHDAHWHKCKAKMVSKGIHDESQSRISTVLTALVDGRQSCRKW